MKIPKRIQEILDKKQSVIDAGREKLNNSIIKLQSSLLDTLVTDVISELDIEDGIIQDTAKNYKLIASLDKVFNSFSVLQAQTLLPQITGTTTEIADLTKSYFLTTISEEFQKRFDKIVEGAKELTDLRFGLKNDLFVRGGPLESLIKDFGGVEVKQIMAKAVSSQMDKKEFIKQMRGFVAGSDGRPGLSERKWKQFAFDVYQQYDASYNMKLADEFGMKYFIYQGGLVGDSRDFCAAHNNKVWSVDETESWATWTPDEGDYPAGYIVKSKTPGEVPSYLGYPGYDPLIDRGGYNCRHSLGYISEELAFKLRPELEK